MSGDEAWERVTASVRREPARVDDPPHLLGRLRRLCRAATTALGASGVGVSVVSSAGHQLTAASSETHAVVEELQFVVGEGPCLTAYATGGPVLTPDVATDGVSRWPGYGPAVLEHGVLAVFAFPLQVGAARLGALDVYRDRPGPLAPQTVSEALLFAEVAMTALLDAGHAVDDPSAPSLDEMLDGHRTEVYQAQGMVMAQLGVELPEAMARLRAHAYAEERPLADVARDVVARKIRFEV